MLILDLLGMYFDAAVVFVTNSSLFSDWLWPFCVACKGSTQFMEILVLVDLDLKTTPRAKSMAMSAN